MKLTRRHIAIVDDEESVCRAIERLLRSAHMDGQTFPSGETFLELLNSRGFDCVILDLHMPQVTGFDVLLQMAAQQVHTPVIVITGHDSPETHARAMAAGAAAYLCKPVNDELLLHAVRVAVGEMEKQ